MLKNLIKKLLPKLFLNWYHLILAYLGNLIYLFPSEKLIVIGVTGTKGKSTTVALTAKICEEAGFKTAAISTVIIKIGENEKINPYKMTMPGRFFLSRFLRQAVNANCQIAVIESSSEGVLQSRHVGIHYDAMVFTNLTPEHVEAHGGFENYKQAKLTFFRNLEKAAHKKIHGQKIPKSIVANIDSEHAKDFLNFQVDNKITFGKAEQANVRGEKMIASEDGVSFAVNGTEIDLKLNGVFDFYNALAALSTARVLGIDLATAKTAIEKVDNVPGRMEVINEGQNFQVMVDYAHEPESLKQLFQTVEDWKHNRIIHVFGSAGGGRDTAKRTTLGKLAGKLADLVIVTNEDSFDEDPGDIIQAIAEGAEISGKVLGKNLFREPDRRLAITKALQMAEENDLVLITGKGTEQKMVFADRTIPWDDRTVTREELKKNYG
jgi:UDP-N-acetylmuramoyl-L-alanyl-D-glutamate--2,6-diaminopimelate ligase